MNRIIKTIKIFGFKAIQFIFGVSGHFFKVFYEQIRDTLISHLIFTIDIETLHFFARLIFHKL